MFNSWGLVPHSGGEGGGGFGLWLPIPGLLYSPVEKKKKLLPLGYFLLVISKIKFGSNTDNLAMFFEVHNNIKEVLSYLLLLQQKL